MKIYFFIMIMITIAANSLFAEVSRKLPKPPKAKKIPVTTIKHGVKLVDNYSWLRDQNEKKSDDVMNYLKAENAYTRKVMKDTELLQEQLFNEMKARMKEDDLSVPVKKGKYMYYSRTEKDKQYPIYCRRLVDNSKPEEILLDENELAKGKEFFDCGTIELSSNEDILAYTADFDGDEHYSLHFIDLKSHKALPDVIENITTNIEWAEDNKTIFYTIMDETTRPYQIKRHLLGTDPKNDDIVYEESDQMFACSIFKSRDKRFLSITTGSTTTTEEYLLEANNPTGKFRLFAPRKQDIEYYVSFQHPYVYITTNENALNFKVMRTTEDKLEKKYWEEFIPHNENVYIDSIATFENYVVITERERGLQTLRYIDVRTNESINLPFAEAVYSVSLGNNPEYKTDKLRYVYYSLTTPESIIDYDFNTGLSELKKRREVLGDFDSRNYVSERIMF